MIQIQNEKELNQLIVMRSKTFKQVQIFILMVIGVHCLVSLERYFIVLKKPLQTVPLLLNIFLIILSTLYCEYVFNNNLSRLQARYPFMALQHKYKRLPI
jgi:hypothetical protein